MKTEKTYNYVEDILRSILTIRLADKVGMCRPVMLSVDDPRRISATIAPVPPPPTQQIVEEQKSRFFNHSDVDATVDYDPNDYL